MFPSLAAAALLYMRKETASQIKNTRLNHILALVGMREINGNLAETPEKLERYDHDGSGIVKFVQGITETRNRGL